MTTTALDPIEELLKRRDAAQTELDTLLTKATEEKRTALSEDEDNQYRALFDEINTIDSRVGELRDMRKRTEAAAEARKVAGETGDQRAHVNEPDIYIRGNGNGNSYFRDLAKRAINGDMGATDRLQRHAKYEAEQRALGNTGAVGGSGGEFAPPGWVIEDWVNVIRAKRVTADLYQKQPVPPKVSSVDFPKILAGTTTAIQTTQNTALSQTDLQTSFVQTGFATIGGKQVISQQLLDQSAINFDQVIMNDLAADYALRVGTQIFLGTGTGTGTGAVVNGLSAATAGSTQPWTQGSPTPAGFYGQCGALLAKFLGARLDTPSCWVMHPRRWFWLASASDPNGRPLVVPNGNAYNPIAVEANGPMAMGYIGTLQGLPVYIDPLVPTNLGAGTNQDAVYLLKTDDLILFESQPQAESFRATYADSVGVLFRMYAYVGTILNRHPESIGVLTGTGLTPPPFAS